MRHVMGTTLVLLMTAVALSPGAQSRTVAERLGYPADAKLLIKPGREFLPSTNLGQNENGLPVTTASMMYEQYSTLRFSISVDSNSRGSCSEYLSDTSRHQL